MKIKTFAFFEPMISRENRKIQPDVLSENQSSHLHHKVTTRLKKQEKISNYIFLFNCYLFCLWQTAGNDVRFLIFAGGSSSRKCDSAEVKHNTVHRVSMRTEHVV